MDFTERETSDKYHDGSPEVLEQLMEQARNNGRKSVFTAAWFGDEDWIAQQALGSILFHRHFVTHALRRGHVNVAHTLAKGCLQYEPAPKWMISQHLVDAYISALVHGEIDLAEYLEDRGVYPCCRLVLEEVSASGHVGALRYLEARGLIPDSLVWIGKRNAEYYGYPKCLALFEALE